jgi:hypothetical protein
MLAEDLNLCVDFTMWTTSWNKRDLWEDRALRAEPIVPVSPDRFLTLMNAEDERQGGAWVLHNVRKHLAHLEAGGTWSPPGFAFIREGRAQKSTPRDLFPWFDSEKPIWWETPVIMALATPDSMGVINNQFDQYSMLASEAWGRPRDQAKYPGQEGFKDYCLQLYYRYLNLGFQLVPSAGSASGVLPNPVGYNRMYVPVNGPLTVEKWYAAARAGKVLVTNGPILFFNVLPAASKSKASIEVTAREPIDRIEIVANGEVMQTLKPTPGALEFKTQTTLDLSRHSWVAARCFLSHQGTIRFAHTSPVRLPGKWDCSADAQYFVDWIGELIAQTKADPKRFASESERNELIAIYLQAMDFYIRKSQPR